MKTEIKHKIIDNYFKKSLKYHVPNFEIIYKAFSTIQKKSKNYCKIKFLRENFFCYRYNFDIENFLMIIYDIQSNKLEKIDDKIRLFIKLNPNFKLAILLLVRVNLTLNFFKIQENEIKYALKYFPEDAFLNNSYGNYLSLISGNKKKGQKFLKKSIVIEPYNEEYLIDLALNSFTIGKVGPSKRFLIRAFKLLGNKNNIIIEDLKFENLKNILIILKDHKNKNKLVILSVLLVCMIFEYYGKFSDTIKINTFACQLFTDIKELKFKLGINYLNIGKNSCGFKLIYEANIDNRIGHKTPLPIYQGNIHRLSKKDIPFLNKSHVLVWLEQGFGDHIHFARYINILKKKAKKISVIGPSSIIELFKYSPDFTDIIFLSKLKIDNYCFQTYLFDLPYLLNSSREKIKSFTLSVEKLRKNKKNLLEKISHSTLINKKKIGIFCEGSKNHLHNHYRSIPIKQFSNIFNTSENQFFLLEKNINAADTEAVSLHTNIINCNGYIKDWSDTACIVSELDLIITCDSSLAHLGGCMNIPTIILLNEVCDWRWGKRGRKSNLYSSVTIMRKKKEDEWHKMLEKVNLNQLIST